MLDLTPCVEWTKSRNAKGYGQVFVNNKNKRAHRHVWEQANGPIPDGLLVLHSCDNPSCVNLEHLSLGTHQENTNQKQERSWYKGGYRGEKHGRAKLKESEVIIIKQRLRNNESVAQIARDFGVPRGTIDSIKRGNNWGWLQC